MHPLPNERYIFLNYFSLHSSLDWNNFAQSYYFKIISEAFCSSRIFFQHVQCRCNNFAIISGPLQVAEIIYSAVQTWPRVKQDDEILWNYFKVFLFDTQPWHCVPSDSSKIVVYKGCELVVIRALRSIADCYINGVRTNNLYAFNLYALDLSKAQRDFP